MEDQRIVGLDNENIELVTNGQVVVHIDEVACLDASFCDQEIANHKRWYQPALAIDIGC